MKKLLLTTSLLLSMGASASQGWSWYPAATSQASSFTQTKELADKSTQTRQVTVAVGDWTDTGGLFNCSRWSPDAADMPGGSSFEQTRTCDKHFFRNFTYTAGGSRIHLRVEWKKESFDQNRTSNSGEADYIVRTENSSTGWVPDSGASSCTDWVPSRDSIGYGKPFNQTRKCTVAEKNTSVTFEYWASGNITTTPEIVDTRSSEEQETRATTGTGGDSDWIWDRVEYGVWNQENGFGSLSCGTFVYPPDKYSDFVVNRICTEPQVRTVYDVYVNFESQFCDEDPREYTCPSRKEKYVELEPEYRSHEVQDSVNVDVIMSDWANTSEIYDCSAWSPSVSGRTSTFTQTKSCKQDQERTREYEVTIREFSSEDEGDLGGPVPESITEIVYSTVDSQTVSRTENRTIYVDSESESKFETSSMSSTQAKQECQASNPELEVLTATGGTYSQQFLRNKYDYYRNFNYDPREGSEYSGLEGTWYANWRFVSKIIATAPSCTYKYKDIDCNPKDRDTICRIE